MYTQTRLSVYRTLFVTLLLITGLMIGSASVQAQDRWGIHVTPTVATTTQDFGSADLDVGYGVEVAFAYRFLSHLEAYAGWGWQHFGTDASLNGAVSDVEETGYRVGLQFRHPIRSLPIDYYARLGGIYNHTEVESDDGDIIADSGHGLGWQAGAGVAVPLGRGWHLMPGFRYQSLSRDLDINGASMDVDLTYFAAEVGFFKTF